MLPDEVRNDAPLSANRCVHYMFDRERSADGNVGSWYRNCVWKDGADAD
jgi:hypothetical protein